MAKQGLILLADDEETFLEATADLLRDEGYECQCVRDGQELSLALAERDYDLLITDLNMPGDRVLESVEATRSEAKALPVVVVTGYPSVPTAVESLRLHVIDYLIKPINYAEFLHSVKRGIEHKRVLQTIRKARLELAGQAQQLEEMEQTLSVFGDTMPDMKEGVPLPFHSFMNNFYEQMKVLTETLAQAQHSLKKEEAGSVDGIPTLRLSDFQKLQLGIMEAIDVLKQTKGSFKSKTLADLRSKLQDVLKQTGTPENTLNRNSENH